MVVRVISEPKKRQTTCYNCKARLEYTQLDIKTAYERDYGGGGDEVSRIDCPCCGKSPIVDRL